MGVFLQSLRDGGPSHAVEKSDDGFAVVPRRTADVVAMQLEYPRRTAAVSPRSG